MSHPWGKPGEVYGRKGGINETLEKLFCALEGSEAHVVLIMTRKPGGQQGIVGLLTGGCVTEQDVDVLFAGGVEVSERMLRAGAIKPAPKDPSPSIVSANNGTTH